MATALNPSVVEIKLGDSSADAGPVQSKARVRSDVGMQSPTFGKSASPVFLSHHRGCCSGSAIRFAAPVRDVLESTYVSAGRRLQSYSSLKRVLSQGESCPSFSLPSLHSKPRYRRCAESPTWSASRAASWSPTSTSWRACLPGGPVATSSFCRRRLCPFSPG